jgi:hypothetical protein
MPQQKKVLPVAITLAVLVGIALGTLGFYFLMKSSSSSGANSETYTAATSTTASSASTSPVTIAGATTTTTTVANTVTTAAGTTATQPVVTSSWQTYTNYELGFSIKYPSDITPDDTSDPGTVNFTIPASYFSTVMVDSDSVSVAVSATCTPVTSFSDAPANSPDSASVYPQTVVLGGENGGNNGSNSGVNSGVSFIENIQSDIGAGNHGTRLIYDTNQNNSCYSITSSERGPNDAGLFGINDPTQIAETDAAHAADAAHVEAVMNAMIQSFTFVNTGAGENEAFYSPNMAGQAAGSGSSASGSSAGAAGNSSIAITTVSPIPVSVGGNLTISGSGFSGHDTIVWISNGTVNGVLWGGMPQSDSLITATIPPQACTQYVGASGLACPSYLIINPGIYTLTVSNENGTTDPVYIKVQ